MKYLLLLIPMLFLLSIPTPVSADHKACSHPVLPMPRTYIIRPDVPGGVQVWRNAFNFWTSTHPGITFVEVPQNYEADVYVVNSNIWSNGVFWVDPPCNRIESVVYVGNTPSSSTWARHEVGHTLGLADHIPSSTNPTGYMNPGVCGVAMMPYSPYGVYQGIMSYCTNSWTPTWDVPMVWWWF